MRLAIITAFTPRYKSIAALCTPSHRCLAARCDGEFFQLPMPEDGHYAWHKVDFVRRWLADWHWVLWLDADCIVPQRWSLPLPHVLNCKYFFPSMQSKLYGRTAGTFASLWCNSSEAFGLLLRMQALRPDLAQFSQAERHCSETGGHEPSADRQALNLALHEARVYPRCKRSEFCGPLDRGLIHYSGFEPWEKEQKLKTQTTA